MDEPVHAATGALQCSLIALRGSLFDASVVAFLRRPCRGEMGEVGEVGALGGDVCARVVESMWRWSLVDDRTLPVVARLSAHFGADWSGHLPLADCPHVSKQVLDRTARLWRNIATIDASDTRVDDEFLECLGESPAAGMLRELNLSECVGITTEGLRALRAFPRLRRLDLSGNSLLGDVLFPVLVDSCPQLEARQQLLHSRVTSLDLRGSDRETQDRSERFLHRLALASLPAHVGDCEHGHQGTGTTSMPLPQLTELRLEFPPLSLLELLQQSGRLGRFEVLGRSDHVIHPSGVKLRRRAEREAAVIAAATTGIQPPTETVASRQDKIIEALWDVRRLRNGSVELRPEFTRRLLDRLRRGHEAAAAGFRWENLALVVDQPGPRGLEILAHFPHLRQLSLLPDLNDDEALLVSTTTTTTPRSDHDNEAQAASEATVASFEALTGLRELFVSQPKAVFTGHQQLTASAWSSILSTLPNLTSLVVNDKCRPSFLSALGSAGLSSLTSLKLRGLRLDHHSSHDGALPLSRALWESLEALPSLRQVDLGVDTELWTHAPVDDVNDVRGGAVEHLVRHAGLEAFRMYGPGDTRLRLACPQLRSCYLNFYPFRDLLGLVDDLVAHSPLLEDLHINGIDAPTPQSSRYGEGAWLGRLLVGLPRLRHLSLTGRTPRSDAGAIASLLAGTSLLLGELDLDCVIDTASLGVVLAACPRLHTLHLAAYRDPAHETAADEAAASPSQDLLLPRTTLPALRYLALGPLRSQADNNESEDDASRQLDLAAVAPHVQKVVLHQVHATKVVVGAGCDALCSLSVWQRSRIAVEVAQARRLRKLALAVDDASTLDVTDCPALAALNIMANGYSARLRISRLDGCPSLTEVTAYGERMSVDAALAARSAHTPP